MGFIASLSLILFLSLAFLGCGGVKSTSGVAQYYGNYHKTGWITEHPGQAVLGVGACTKCHEISIIKVGSGVPTCMTTGCHHQSTPGYADPAIHGVRAKMAVNVISGGSLTSCQICHGTNFSGGASANTCFTCHGVNAPHPPKPWNAGAVTWTHSSTDPSNAAVCAQCHYPGSLNNPAGHPSTPAPAGTQPGCYNATLCHGANTAPHPVPFLKGQTDTSGNGHLTVTAGAFTADCATCHAYSGTSPKAGAPLCNVCHQLADPTTAGTDAGTCRSCHAGTAGLPSGPGGTSFPSIAGAHAKHMALATALSCDTCHAGSGTGTTAHYTNANARIAVPAGPAPVVIDVTFKGKPAGNPAFVGASLTCSNISCHGGQTTPSWQNGTINSSTQCTACHGVATTAGTITQFNDAFGRHSSGTHDATNATNAIACTTCHSMGNGSPGALAHFKYLNTPAVDGVSTGTPTDQMPSGTIVFDPAFLTGAGSYSITAAGTAQGNGACTLTCHTPTKTHIHTGAPLDTWTASGAPHPVPFLSTSVPDTQGNGHMTATLAVFTTDCSSCHAMSGTSPTASAPACMTCHAKADPTQPGTDKTTCLSCHVGTAGLPTGPTGTAFPNFAGAHGKHLALPTTLTCDSCHAGSGTGTTTHYANAKTPTVNPAPVVIDVKFNAQTGGTATFTPAALTCSSVSCHGGQTTPGWRTAGSINSLTQCSACHAINSTGGNAQYNDAIGRHAWGTHNGAAKADCTICHSMDPLANTTSNGAANHFAGLDLHLTTSATKRSSNTIVFKNTTTYPISGTLTYDVTTSPFTELDGGCALTCHGQNHVPATNHWGAAQGAGVAHPVPFYTGAVTTSGTGNTHQSVTLTQFNSECSSCHDFALPTSKTGPACSVCHTLGLATTAADLGVGTCLSCHIGASFSTLGPQGAATQVWPNTPGAHAKHLGLLTFTRTTPALPTAALVASDCAACHLGSLPGDTGNTHYSNASKRVATPVSSGPAPVAFDPTFNSQGSVAGTAGTTAMTCSNISCHGGQTTPAWQNGTITKNATTYCNACHKITATATEYNDAIGLHIVNGQNTQGNGHYQTCDYCHDMTQAKPGAQNHFKYLDTSVVSGVSGTPSDQFPSDTILFGPSVAANGTGPTYVVTGTGFSQGKGGCTLTCHSQSHDINNNKWR